MAASGVTSHPGGTGYAHTIDSGARSQSPVSLPSNASEEVHPPGSPGGPRPPSSTSSILNARSRRGSFRADDAPPSISENSWHGHHPIDEDWTWLPGARGGGGLPPGGGVPPAGSASTRSAPAGNAPAGNPREKAEKLQEQYWNDQRMFGNLQAIQGVAKDESDTAKDIVDKWFGLLDIFKQVVTK